MLHRRGCFTDVLFSDISIQMPIGLGYQDVNEQVCMIQMGIGKIGRQGDCVFKMTISLSQVRDFNFCAVGLHMRFNTLLVGSVGFNVSDTDLGHPGPLIVIQHHVQRGRNFFRDIRLYRESIFGAPVIGFRPEMKAVFGAYQLRGDT